MLMGNNYLNQIQRIFLSELLCDAHSVHMCVFLCVVCIVGVAARRQMKTKKYTFISFTVTGEENMLKSWERLTKHWKNWQV